jgi:predicted nuclease of restriction endonuclease-like RecB superfamily
MAYQLVTGRTAAEGIAKIKAAMAGQVVSPHAKRKRSQPPPGHMNKTERLFADELELARLGGLVSRWWFEPFSLKLAPRTHYRPDFLVHYADGAIELVEIKGFWEEDAKVKFKVARDMFPCFHWRAVRRSRGQWVDAI